jgi:hypothetical protein
VQRETALEAQEEMLAVRVRRLHRPAREPLRPALGCVARVEREDLLRYPLAKGRADA